MLSEIHIRKIIQKELKKLFESRMSTSTFSIAGQIGRLPGFKILDIRGISDGTAALMRYEADGNAYEVQIRPASLVKDKEMWGDILNSKAHPAKTWFKNI